jgi:hypothetical protein
VKLDTQALLGGILAVACAACAGVQSQDDGPTMDEVAEGFVKLALAAGQHDADFVDAYYGPPEWAEEAKGGSSTLAEIRVRAEEMIERLRQSPPGGDDDEMVVLRHRYLDKQLQALVARIEMLEGAEMSFDEESMALYGAVAPSYTDGHFQEVLDELETLLPGEGALVERFDEFKKGFLVPGDKLDAVFQAAIGACRERTEAHVDLPAGESFEVEYVSDKPWGGYNWYKGNYHSLIQVNTDEVYIDRAVDLACHEGYPGHHTYNVLLEKHLVRGRGWVEFSVYPLYSPQSLIAEGTAEYGIDVVFPGEARVDYERETLFPIAGIDPAGAEKYYRIQRLVKRLSFAANEAARRYLDGEMDAEETTEWLMRYAMMPRQRAERRVRFIDKYRSYVINYNLGKKLVERYLESAAGGSDNTERLWEEYVRIISTPRLTSDLQ